MEKHASGKNPKIEQPNPQEEVDAVLEHMLYEGKEIGTGKDGIVFRINLTALPKSERQTLVQGKIITPDDDAAVAAKILKVYKPELGDYEFKMHTRAREILSREKNAARVPGLTSLSDHRINEETRHRLNLSGAQLEDKAVVIIMDYVNGSDLGNITYNFVLKEMGYADDYIVDLSYAQKEQLVGRELDFEQPNLEYATSPEEEESMQALTFDRNEDKLIKYLKMKGFKLDPIIFEKVDNAVRALNHNGMYHNDLHRRNVMIDDQGEVYLIDYGRAGSEKRADGIADTVFSKKWRTLSLSAAEEQDAAFKKERAEVERMQEKLKTNPAQAKIIEAFIKSITAKGVPALEKELALSRADDSRFEKFLIMLHIAYESGALSKDMLSSFLESLERKSLRAFESNRVHKLRKIGYLP